MKKIFTLAMAAALVCAGCADDAKDDVTVADTPKPTHFIVTFELNGGSDVEPITVDSGMTVPAPATPTKTKSCFMGWYTGSAFSDAFDFSTPITKNTTVYAKWSKQHTVTFVLNGGAGQAFCHVCDSVKFPIPSEPTRGGYSFVAWCVDSAFSAPFNPYYITNRRPPYTYDTLRITKDTMLYALWINAEKIQRRYYNEFYWCAYEDEPGLYSNQTTGTNVGDGRLNTGGEANDVCRSKGDGWYLPASNEGLGGIAGKHWLSTQSNATSAYYLEIGVPFEAVLKTEQMPVRCVWRPLYEQ